MTTKFEIERFDGKTDFDIWKRKIRALLVQHKVAKILDVKPEFTAALTPAQKSDMSEIAYNTTILHLGDNVLRRIGDVEGAVALWDKLEELYVSKTLTNKIYLKERYFGYKMNAAKSLNENLDDFTRISNDLANSGEKIDGENQAVILPNLLPEKYGEVKAVVKYGRDC